MAFEPTVPRIRPQREVERHSIACRVSMTTCNSTIIVDGAGIYTIRKCVYEDANKV